MIYTSYKKIDEVGRIVLPKDIRNKLDLHINEVIKIDVEDNKIVITKAEQTCAFCGTTDNLESFRGKNICTKCIRELNKT